MKINGTWKSSSGSTLKIKEKKGKIFGTYQLGKGKKVLPHEIIGSIDPDKTAKVRPLSFSAAWTDKKGESVHAITAYTGQLNAKSKKPNIEVVFIHANDKLPLWRGTGLSYENYEKVD